MRTKGNNHGTYLERSSVRLYYLNHKRKKGCATYFDNGPHQFSRIHLVYLGLHLHALLNCLWGLGHANGSKAFPSISDDLLQNDPRIDLLVVMEFG
jgi:hypothetical protein